MKKYITEMNRKYDSHEEREKSGRKNKKRKIDVKKNIQKRIQTRRSDCKRKEWLKRKKGNIAEKKIYIYESDKARRKIQGKTEDRRIETEKEIYQVKNLNTKII